MERGGSSVPLDLEVGGEGHGKVPDRECEAGGRSRVGFPTPIYREQYLQPIPVGVFRRISWCLCLHQENRSWPRSGPDRSRRPTPSLTIHGASPMPCGNGSNPCCLHDRPTRWAATTLGSPTARRWTPSSSSSAPGAIGTP